MVYFFAIFSFILFIYCIYLLNERRIYKKINNTLKNIADESELIAAGYKKSATLWEASFKKLKDIYDKQFAFHTSCNTIKEDLETISRKN